MKMPIFVVVMTALLTGPAAHSAPRICPELWRSAANSDDCSLTPLTVPRRSKLFGKLASLEVSIRNGYLPESPSAQFKGNIIYYEGLGDSMLNHLPLFLKLTDAGYRVIAFDYMGQGGSTGSMNDTRIRQIGTLGDQIWALNARDLEHYPEKTIIGWSTGGLAAYLQARNVKNINTLVLIAPGIAPNLLVGKLEHITLSSLTTAQYGPGIYNPHIDPIKPDSPLLVPNFALDLTLTARNEIAPPVPNFASKLPLVSRLESSYRMQEGVNGFVLLSGDSDTYVDAKKTCEIVSTYAQQFSVRQYPGALHEIDNEAKPNGPDARQDILDFLKSVGSGKAFSPITTCQF